MNNQKSATSEFKPSDSLLATRQLAGLAMQGLISRHGIPEVESAREEFALWSYRMAQAMLATEKQLHIT